MEGGSIKALIGASMEVSFLFCNFWSSESLDGAPSSLLVVLVIICVCVYDSLCEGGMCLREIKYKTNSLSLSKSEVGRQTE